MSLYYLFCRFADDPSPPSNHADNLSDADRETMSPGIDCTEINTRVISV